MASRSRGPSLLVGGRSIPIDPKAEGTKMNNWYTTDRIAHERRADFQREADVVSLLTSLEDLDDPAPGPIDRLFRSIDRIKATLSGGLDRRLGGLRHGPLSGAGRHG